MSTPIPDPGAVPDEPNFTDLPPDEADRSQPAVPGPDDVPDPVADDEEESQEYRDETQDGTDDDPTVVVPPRPTSGF